MALHTFCQGYFRPILKIAKSDCKLRRVWPHRRVRLDRTDFHRFGCLKISRNMCRKSKFHSYSTGQTGTLREDQFSAMISWRWIVLRTRNDSDRNCRCTKITFYFHYIYIFFSENLERCETMCRNVMDSNNITWRMRIACRVTKAKISTLRIGSIFSFPLGQ